MLAGERGWRDIQLAPMTLAVVQADGLGLSLRDIDFEAVGTTRQAFRFRQPRFTGF